MKRKGRKHLPEVDPPVAPTGFERSAYTFEGTVDRMGAFARGVNARKRGRMPVRLVILVWVALVVLVMLVPILARLV
jgi:hypothetical protein